MIYLILSLLVLAEAAWDSYHEVKLNKSPNYAGSNYLRLVVGGAFWLVLYFKLPFERWIFFPVMALPYFWFNFDWWLNLCRTALGKYRPYWYIGKNSKLDKWQRAHGGSFNWFWIKLGLAILGVVIFEFGLNRIAHIFALNNLNFFN